MKCARCEETLAGNTGIGFQFSTIHALVCRPCNVKLWRWLQQQPEWREVAALEIQKNVARATTMQLGDDQEAWERKLQFLVNRITELEYTHMVRHSLVVDKLLEELPLFGQEYSEFE